MKVIKLKMHDPSKVKCPFVTIFEQLERLLNTKQEEEEALIEHTKRFKQAQDNVKSIMGMELLHKFIENTEEFINESDNDARDEMKEKSNEVFVAHAFLRNCDNLKCRSLKKNFQTQCPLNDNQCPKQMSAVSDTLGSHQWDPAHEEKKKKRKQQRQESQQNNDNNENSGNEMKEAHN